jgi:hypothetical protein
VLVRQGSLDGLETYICPSCNRVWQEAPLLRHNGYIIWGLMGDAIAPVAEVALPELPPTAPPAELPAPPAIDLPPPGEGPRTPAGPLLGQVHQGVNPNLHQGVNGQAKKGSNKKPQGGAA